MCVMVSAWAVELPKQGFGLQIGYAQPTLRINDSSHKDTLSTNVKMNGFKVGVVYDGSIIAGFGTSIGLNYTFRYIHRSELHLWCLQQWLGVQKHVWDEVSA